MSTDSIGRRNEIAALGYVQLPVPVMLDPRLSNSAKIAYCVLRRFSWDEGQCYPGMARIAKSLRITERGARKLIGELCEVGLVTKQSRKGTTNLYLVEESWTVYGMPENPHFLMDEAIDFLIEAGEDAAMDGLIKRRERYLAQFGEPMPTYKPTGTAIERDDDEKVDSPEDKSVSPKSTKPVVRNWEETTARIQGQRDKSIMAAERRKAKRSELLNAEPVKRKKPDIEDIDEEVPQFTTKDLEIEFRTLLKQLWPDIPGVAPPWGVKQFSIVKGLVRKYRKDGMNIEDVFWAFLEVPKQWDTISSQQNIKGYPNVQLVAHLSERWFPQLWSGDIDTTTDREKARKKRNWDESRASDAERAGGYTLL